MKRQKGGKRLLGLWLLLAAAFWGLLPGGMAGAGQPLAGELLCKEGDKLLLCAHGQTGPYLACIQGTGSFLLAGGDEGFARVDLGYPLLGAAYRGGRLFVFREWEVFFCADAYTGSLEQGETCVTSLTADDVALFDCTAQGEVYAVAKGSLQTLQLFSLDGDSQERGFDKNITLLQVTESGQLWVCTEDSFFMGSSLENLKAIAGGRPQRVIGENAFLDSGGNVWQVKGEQAEPVLEGIPPQSLCRADRAGITYADSTGRVHRVLWGGEEAGTCTPDGKPLALTEKGVLMSREGMLYYAPYAFTQEQPSLSPSPSPSVSPSPGPSEKPSWLELGDGYFYITGEVPVEWLLEELKPDVALVKTPEGETVINGLLGTGMSVFQGKTDTYENETVVIVWGDCSGNGRTGPSDMEEAQRMLLHREDDMVKPAFLAADRDRDGEITAKDLLWLSGAIEKAANGR